MHVCMDEYAYLCMYICMCVGLCIKALNVMPLVHSSEVPSSCMCRRRSYYIILSYLILIVSTRNVFFDARTHRHELSRSTDGRSGSCSYAARRRKRSHYNLLIDLKNLVIKNRHRYPLLIFVLGPWVPDSMQLERLRPLFQIPCVQKTNSSTIL